MEILTIIILVAGVIVLIKTVRMVPQGYEWTVERFGKYTHTMNPGLHFLMPWMQRVGRKVNMISLDDGYSPPKTIEQTRKMVEQDEVLFMFNSLGTATNTAVQKYLNAKKVPQLFLGAGGAKFTDPANYLGQAPVMVDRALAASAALKA